LSLACTAFHLNGNDFWPELSAAGFFFADGWACLNEFKSSALKLHMPNLALGACFRKIFTKILVQLFDCAYIRSQIAAQWI
jgi:hypothetical protein